MNFSLLIYFLACSFSFAEIVKNNSAYDLLKQELQLTRVLKLQNISIERVNWHSNNELDQQLIFIAFDANMPLLEVAENSEIFRNVKPQTFILKEELAEFKVIPNFEKLVNYKAKYEGISSYCLSIIGEKKEINRKILEAVIIQTNAKSSKLKSYHVFICYYQPPTNGPSPSKIIRREK